MKFKRGQVLLVTKPAQDYNRSTEIGDIVIFRMPSDADKYSCCYADEEMLIGGASLAIANEALALLDPETLSVPQWRA